jgi:hypothetical protein
MSKIELEAHQLRKTGNSNLHNKLTSTCGQSYFFLTSSAVLLGVVLWSFRTDGYP